MFSGVRTSGGGIDNLLFDFLNEIRDSGRVEESTKGFVELLKGVGEDSKPGKVLDIFTELGYGLERMGDRKECMEVYNKGINIAKKVKDKKSLLGFFLSIATGSRNLQMDHGIFYYYVKAAKKVFNEIDINNTFSEMERRIYNIRIELAECIKLKLRFQYDEALEKLDLLISLEENQKTESSEYKKDHSFYIAEAYHSQGDILFHKKEYSEAIGSMNKALSIYESYGYVGIVSQVLGSFGRALIHSGESGESLEFLKKSIKLSRKTKDRIQLGQSLFQIGIAHHNLGNWEKSATYKFQADKMFKETEDFFSEGLNAFHLCFTLEHLGRYDEMVLCHKRVLYILRNKKRARRRLQSFGINRIIVLGKLCSVLCQHGHLDESYHYFRELSDAEYEKFGVSCSLHSHRLEIIKKSNLEIIKKSNLVRRKKCVRCGRFAKKKCGRCGGSIVKSYYCSSRCQIGDWKRHKMFCN